MPLIPLLVPAPPTNQTVTASATTLNNTNIKLSTLGLRKFLIKFFIFRLANRLATPIRVPMNII